MAIAKKTAANAKAPGKGLAAWDEKLAQYASAAVANEANTSSGITSFSTKSGVLALGDDAMPGNQVAVIVLDSVLHNTYYEQGFDADVRAPVTCYAFGRVDDAGDLAMAPHPDVVARQQAQNDVCETCPMNAWGSAERGRGKACGNRRRLLVIPAGEVDKRGGLKIIDDPKHYQEAQPAFISVPVTSSAKWATYVKGLATTLHRPPFAVITMVKLVPSQKNNMELEFEAIEEIDARVIDIVIERHELAKTQIEQPMRLDVEDDETKPARDKGKTPAKKAAAKKTAPARAAGKPTTVRKY